MNYVLAPICAFAVAVLLGLLIIPWLRRMNFGQSILEIGPSWHKAKQGTPVMGGLIFIGATSAVTLVIGGLVTARGGGAQHFLVLGLALAFSLIGFTDDYTKITKKRNLGLTAWQKTVFQILVAAVFLSVMRIGEHFTPNVYVPFFNVTFSLDIVIYLIIATIMIYGFDNAANLTDGVDGLASGVTIPICLFYGVIAMLTGAEGAAVLALALGGALLGFLVFNYHPAKVFMGDTGSLFIGGIVCGLAFSLDIPLTLLIACGIYLLEAVSVVLQVGYFKLTHGKRLFKMAPIHHHFEKSGWSEKKIFFVFTGLTVLLCAIAFLSVLPRLLP